MDRVGRGDAGGNGKEADIANDALSPALLLSPHAFLLSPGRASLLPLLMTSWRATSPSTFKAHSILFISRSARMSLFPIYPAIPSGPSAPESKPNSRPSPSCQPKLTSLRNLRPALRQLYEDHVPQCLLGIVGHADSTLIGRRVKLDPLVVGREAC